MNAKILTFVLRDEDIPQAASHIPTDIGTITPQTSRHKPQMTDIKTSTSCGIEG